MTAAEGALFTPRWRRVTLGLTLLLAIIEGGFLLLVTTAGAWLATPVAGPLSLGLVLGTAATLAGCAIALVYVLWANRAGPAP